MWKVCFCKEWNGIGVRDNEVPANEVDAVYCLNHEFQLRIQLELLKEVLETVELGRWIHNNREVVEVGGPCAAH